MEAPLYWSSVRREQEITNLSNNDLKRVRNPFTIMQQFVRVQRYSLHMKPV